MTATCKRLVILEGPDGAGKSTLAARLVKDLDARYVHLGPLPGVSQGLARFYLEAMLPALLGYQNVVMDRSWISEPIYGDVHRGGEDRVGPIYARMLERVALRCDPLLVLCLPDLPTCTANYRARKGQELLRHEEDLASVWRAYRQLLHAQRSTWALALPTTVYDYAQEDSGGGLYRAVRGVAQLGGNKHRGEHGGMMPGRLEHPLDVATAGNLAAPVVLVGEGFANQKNHDPLQQHPFVSFSGLGCSAWLTKGLLDVGMGEANLLWANADLGAETLRRVIAPFKRERIYALGAKAFEALDGLDGVVPVTHPQHAKRFAYSKPYQLFEELRLLVKVKG